jgi:hypothetical protein
LKTGLSKYLLTQKEKKIKVKKRKEKRTFKIFGTPLNKKSKHIFGLKDKGSKKHIQ